MPFVTRQFSTKPSPTVGLPSTQKFILRYFIKGRVVVFINMLRAPRIPLLLLHIEVKQQHLFRMMLMHRDHSPWTLLPWPETGAFSCRYPVTKYQPVQAKAAGSDFPMSHFLKHLIKETLKNLPLIRLLMVWIHWEWAALINLGAVKPSRCLLAILPVCSRCRTSPLGTLFFSFSNLN